MSRKHRAWKLMATTSLLACSFAASPVTVDFELDRPILKTAPKVAAADSSCFVAGTRVRMADGGVRAIEDLRVGDCVLNGKGGSSRVTAIERPELGARSLYAFNDEAAFVTAEHPFLTPAGWKSIDPTATARENAAIAVSVLMPGDQLAIWRPQAQSPQSHIRGNLALAEETAFELAYCLVTRIRAVARRSGAAPLQPDSRGRT